MSSLKKSPSAPIGWREKWENLEPNKRRSAVAVGVLAAVGLFAFFIVSSELGSNTATPTKRIENALVVGGNRDLAAAGVANELRDFQRRMRELEGENARMKTAMDRMQNTPAGGASVDSRLQAEVSELRRMMAEMQTSDGRASSAGQPPRSGRANPPMPTRPTPASQSTGPMSTAPVGVGPIPGDEAPLPPPAYGGIRTITEEPPAATEKPKIAVEQRLPDMFYLPTGSMITGVLLAGVDAPTGRSALKDPIPVLARVKQDAILPNRYRADVKECFALLESSGDLASERAMMRLTNISCVRRDKSVIDVPVSGYAVGEDGRAGLRGRLVSKQGQVLAKAMFAGFAEGISSAFGGNRNQQMGFAGIQDVDYGSVPERGALRGASSALDRIAAYYLDLADQLHPTVEIDAGRRITIVLLKGRDLASLDTRGSTRSARNGAQ